MVLGGLVRLLRMGFVLVQASEGSTLRAALLPVVAANNRASLQVTATADAVVLLVN